MIDGDTSARCGFVMIFQAIPLLLSHIDTISGHCTSPKVPIPKAELRFQRARHCRAEAPKWRASLRRAAKISTPVAELSDDDSELSTARSRGLVFSIHRPSAPWLTPLAAAS